MGMGLEKSKMSPKLGHGFVSSCVGPVVDISMSSQNHEIYQLQALWVSLGISKNLGLPCIYDALFLIRPNCSFREGIMMKNNLRTKRKFFEEMNKEESPIMGVMAQNKRLYSELNSNQILKNEILSNSLTGTALGMASALILVKSYANWLIVEVNQICYGGVLRTIALGFTEGISSWKVESLCTFKPLVVPVGRSTLGRLFNVLGATIDAYVGIDELPIYSDYIVSFDQYEAERTTNSFQRVQFSRTGEATKIIELNTEEELQKSYSFSQPSLKSILDVCTSIRKLTTETIRLESLGFIIIVGIVSDIINITKLKPLSFSNVSSESGQKIVASHVKSYILSRDLTTCGKGLMDTISAEVADKIYNTSGIKGSVARDRDLSPIHKAPVRIQNLSVSLDLFETGIKVVDLLTPYKKGGKIGLFGGAGVGKTVVIME